MGNQNGETVALWLLHGVYPLFPSSPPEPVAHSTHDQLRLQILADAIGIDTKKDTAQLQEIALPTASISVIDFPKDGPPEVLYTGKKPSLEASASDAWGG